MERTFVLVAVLLAAGCVGPAGEGATVERAALGPTPLATLPGGLPVDVLDYELGMEVFDDGRGRLLPMDLRGVLRVPDGEGPFPVLAFVHGYHGTCQYPLLPQLPTYWGNSSPSVHALCPDAAPVAEPTESFRGYDYFSDALASHGYVVASIDAAQLNDNWVAYDWTLRAKLVLRTLDHLRDGNDGEGALAGAVAGKLDLSRVGIMGHSRGGQGVTTAFVLNKERPEAERHGIVAVFGLAPVDAPSESSLVDDAAYATLLPYCDGDVWSLHGALTYDRARYSDASWPKVQFLVDGSNHNFYNTAWGHNADDAAWMADEHCGRDAPEGAFLSFDDVLRHGGHVMGAFFRAYVGGETAFLPFVRGEQPLPHEACPQVPVDCARIVRVSYHPPTADQLLVEDGDLVVGPASRNDLGGASRFEGFDQAEACEGSTCADAFNVHAAPLLRLAWSAPATWTAELPKANADVRGFRWLSVRLALDGDVREPPRVVLGLVDADGTSYVQDVGDVFAAPGGVCEFDPFPLSMLQDPTACNARVVLNEHRLLLDGSPVDLARVRAVTLSVEGAGEMLAADLMFGR